MTSQPARTITAAWLGLAAAAVVLAVCAYVGGGPFIALSHIRQGLAEQDSELLSESVDFPLLRENVKAQLAAFVVKQADTSSESLGSMGKGFAALGTLFVNTMVDGLVDNYVTPTGLALIMRGNIAAGSKNTQNSSNDILPDARIEFASLDRVYVVRPTSGGGELKLVLTRQGLSWRLTNLLIPFDELQKVSGEDTTDNTAANVNSAAEMQRTLDRLTVPAPESSSDNGDKNDIAIQTGTNTDIPADNAEDLIGRKAQEVDEKSPPNDGANMEVATNDGTIAIPPSPLPESSLSASEPQPAVAISPPRQLSEGTVLCSSESDFVRRQADLALTFPTHTLAPSCFYLKSSASVVVLPGATSTRVRVRVRDGEHAGQTAWTEADR